MSLYAEIEKKLGTFRLRVKLEAGEETLALLGASGCGKSVTLQCIAGILKPDRGRIVADGVTFFDSERRIDLSPQARRAGLLFQNYALFPHMTVRENILAGARREKQKALRRARVEEMLERFDLTAVAGQYPSQLSGGQQQRTALARILVSEPRILLLDEPFSALDSHLRFRMEQQVREVIRAFGKTVLLVSHDRDEVYRMSDRIAVMGNGVIDTTGEKKAVFAKPETCNAAVLTGCKNISRLVREGENRVFAADWGLRLTVAELPADAEYLGIRMHDIRPGAGENSALCRVAGETENPFSYTVFLLPEGASAPLAWETEKAEWRRLRAERVEICLPAQALMPLRDG